MKKYYYILISGSRRKKMAFRFYITNKIKILPHTVMCFTVYKLLSFIKFHLILVITP